MAVIDTIIKKEALQQEPTFLENFVKPVKDNMNSIQEQWNKLNLTDAYNDVKHETLQKVNAFTSMTTSNTSSDNAPWLQSGMGSSFINPTCINDNGTYLWCFMKAYENKQMTSLAMAYDASTKPIGKQLASFQFLMSDKCDLTINHEWDTGQDILINAAQKALDKVAPVANLAAIGSKALGGIDSFINANKQMNWTTENLQNNLASSAKALASGTSNPFKWTLDETKLFKSSTRQSITLNFTLGVWKSSGGSYADKLYNEVVLPVKSLLWCSCANKAGVFSIEYPYLFSVKVGTTRSSRNIFEMEYAFLTSVQPTFNAPWVNGMPMTCDLSLTFENLMPVYKQTYQPGGFNGLNKL